MNKRSREILLLLTNQEYDYRISELAEKFQVSERTIRNDINAMNDYLADQKLTRIQLGSNGLLLTADDIKKVSLLDSENDFYTYRLSKDERKTLTATILLQANHHVTLSNIADMLFVSRATIINDLDRVKQFFESKNLHVVSHSNKGLLLEGKESDKRTVLLQLMTAEKNSMVQGFMKGLDMEFQLREEDKSRLQKLINEQEHVHGRFLTDSSFDYLMQYLMLMILRIKQENVLEDNSSNEDSKYEMAKDIYKYVALYWELDEYPSEIQFLAELLGSFSYMKKERRNQRIIGLQLITRRFIECISQDLAVDLKRDFDFYENLVNHLESIFTKSFSITRRDEFLTEIIEQNKNILHAVQKHIEMLEAYVGRTISAIEMDYIVIHICAALERKKKKEVDFQIVIVCNGGVGTSQLLLAKMKNRFDFHVVDVVSAHQLKDNYDDVDMVISTVPLKDYGKDYILVTPVFSDEDYLRVNKKIKELQKAHGIIKHQRTKNTYHAVQLIQQLQSLSIDGALMRDISKVVYDFFGETYELEEPLLYDLLTPDNIQLNLTCKDWKEAIKVSAQPLLEKDYIEKRYIDAMIQNVIENGAYIVVSPGFALPHEGFDRGSKKVGMNLIRLKNPVVIEDLDGEQEVVSFFCCMSTVDHKKHMKAFFHLVNLLTNHEFKRLLMEAKTSKEVAQTIKTYELRIKE